jgi:hypothetical protein
MGGCVGRAAENRSSNLPGLDLRHVRFMPPWWPCRRTLTGLDDMDEHFGTHERAGKENVMILSGKVTGPMSARTAPAHILTSV